MTPHLAVYYLYVDCNQSWPDPPTGLTLCTSAKPEEMTIHMQEPGQVLVDCCLALLCVVVLELLLRWRDRRAVRAAQARLGESVEAAETGRMPMQGGISQRGCCLGGVACLLLLPIISLAVNHLGRIGAMLLGVLLMLACLAARRLRSQGLSPAWALPALVMPLLLFLGTFVPALHREWFLMWPEVSPYRFGLMSFVCLWTQAFFIGLGLVNVTRRRGARGG